MKNILIVFLLIFTINADAQMTNQEFKISKITIAVTNINAMVTFYKTVFKCEFTENKVYGTTLFSGTLGDIKLLLCPNEIAGVKAEQNRQQFEFTVKDLDVLIHDAKTAGGTIKDEIHTSGKERSVTVVDPDGNTIVFKHPVK